jgi:hypothetical protein
MYIKKFLLFVFLLIVSFVFNNQAFAFSGEGDGLSPETAFIITTCSQLQEMNDDLDAYYKLGGNIDCGPSASEGNNTRLWNENTSEWVDAVVGGTLIDDPYTGVVNNGYYGFDPIGRVDSDSMGSGFTGTLDGQNYTISDLWIFRKEQANSGLIGYATDAIIKNIILSDARIVGQSNTGAFLGYGSGVSLENLTNDTGMVRAYLAYSGGGIAGQLENTSTGSELTVTGGTVHGSGNVIGGLVGRLTASTITDAISSADVDGGEYVGGAFGFVIDSQISYVDVSGDVESNDSEDEYIYDISKSGNYSGGFAGRITSSSLSNVTSTGSVLAESDYAGGFVGFVESSDITDASSSGEVRGNEYVGGFAGSVFDSDIEDSIATGDVYSLGSYAGGFSGISQCESSFLRVSAIGDVDAGNSYVGGFTGYDACEGPGSTFTLTSAHGDVSGNNVVGGFIGYGNVSTFLNAYSSGSVIGNDQVGSFASDITSSSLENVYARGSVSLYGEGTFFGGFAKDASDSTFTNSFWDKESIGQEEACQTGECAGLIELTTFQALTPSTYVDAGWDFEDTWEMNADNNGYPHFFWEYFEYEEPELLSLSATDITQTSAVLHGRVVSGDFIQFGLGFAFAPVPLDEAGESLQFIGPSDDFDEETGNYMKDLGSWFDAENALTCGTTYYYTAIGFQGIGMLDNLTAAENELSFTTLDCDDEAPAPSAPRRSSGGRASAAFLSSLGVKVINSNDDVKTDNKTKEETKEENPKENTCPADQILTQNLRSGSRNGRFNTYTGGIVTQANILQAHLNRLGFNSGPVDGILGRLSDGAIRRMQTFLGTRADGFVGPITRGLINNSCGSEGLQN